MGFMSYRVYSFNMRGELERFVFVVFIFVFGSMLGDG